jgi:hypothetical protein
MLAAMPNPSEKPKSNEAINCSEHGSSAFRRQHCLGVHRWVTLAGATIEAVDQEGAHLLLGAIQFFRERDCFECKQNVVWLDTHLDSAHAGAPAPRHANQYIGCVIPAGTLPPAETASCSPRLLLRWLA